MAQSDTEFPIDKQGKFLADVALGAFKAENLMTFAGATANDPGNYDGTGNPATLFTVTGAVSMRLLAVCITAVVGASATIKIGVSGDNDVFIAQTTAASIIAKEIWHDASPDAYVELTSVLKENIVTEDVIQVLATANITSGVIKYVAIWYPLTKDGKVLPA